MKSFVEELWYGNLMPSEEYSPNDEEKAKLKKEYKRALDALEHTFSPAQRELFEQYCTAEVGYASFFERRAFCKGFRYGARLLLDVVLFEE